MATPVITQLDMTTPRVKITLDYSTYMVELNYDNNILTNCVLTPTVPDTDPDYIAPYRMNGALPIRKIVDAIYDYRSKV